jgi:hypothetical protein
MPPIAQFSMPSPEVRVLLEKKLEVAAVESGSA